MEEDKIDYGIGEPELPKDIQDKLDASSLDELNDWLEEIGD